MCRMHSWSKYNVGHLPQGQIYRIFSCRARNYFLLWHWLPLFSTWFYHHKSMCCIHSWSWYNIDLWPQDQIYMVFGMATCICSDQSFLYFWIIISYLAHECITIGQCVTYFHDLCMTLTFGLNIKIIYFHHEFALLFDISTPQHVVYIHLFSTKLGIKNLWVEGT